MTPSAGSGVPGETEPPRDGGPAEAAHYIKSTLEDLSRLARRHGLDMLGYLLDMAHMEAEESVRLSQRKSSGR